MQKAKRLWHKSNDKLNTIWREDRKSMKRLHGDQPVQKCINQLSNTLLNPENTEKLSPFWKEKKKNHSPLEDILARRDLPQSGIITFHKRENQCL